MPSMSLETGQCSQVNSVSADTIHDSKEIHAQTRMKLGSELYLHSLGLNWPQSEARADHTEGNM